MPILQCSSPDGFSKEIDLAEVGEVSVGRSPDNTLTEGGHALSRRHSLVIHADGITVVRDMNSSNGTFLNGEEVHRPRILSHGDVVTCGELSMTFYSD